MIVPQKVQYSLRALFELAKRKNDGYVKIADIAYSQAIPVKFLEVILSQLKQAGFVDSRRGADGGYRLSKQPEKITVGELIRFMQGGFEPVICLSEGSKENCALFGDCVFLSLWEEISMAISEVCDKTTIQDLIIREQKMSGKKCLNFEI